MVMRRFFDSSEALGGEATFPAGLVRSTAQVSLHTSIFAQVSLRGRHPQGRQIGLHHIYLPFLSFGPVSAYESIIQAFVASCENRTVLEEIVASREREREGESKSSTEFDRVRQSSSVRSIEELSTHSVQFAQAFTQSVHFASVSTIVIRLSLSRNIPRPFSS